MLWPTRLCGRKSARAAWAKNGNRSNRRAIFRTVLGRLGSKSKRASPATTMLGLYRELQAGVNDPFGEPSDFFGWVSNPHRHNDIPILIIIAFGGPKLAGGLRILHLEPYFARSGGFEEIDEI